MKNNSSFIKTVLTYAFFLAVLSLIPPVVFYLLDLSFFNFLNIGILFVVAIAIVVVFMVIGIKEYRDKVLEGKINYGKKFLTALIIGVIGSVVSSLLGYLFFELVDPNYIANQADEFIFRMEEFMSEDQLSELRKNMDDAKDSVKRTTQGLLQGTIGSAVIALIAAASAER